MKTIALLILLASSCCLCEEGLESNGPDTDTTSLTSARHIPDPVLDSVLQRISNLETRLQTSEEEVRRLKDKPQVAFSVALRVSGAGNTGPFSTHTTLQYKKIFSNTGNCYNPSTGIFTAMVKGIYFFRFSMYASHSPPPNAAVSLMKNNEKLVTVWDNQSADLTDMGSNAVVIPLEVGDNVYVILQANKIIYDDAQNYNTFTGFLLFTM